VRRNKREKGIVIFWNHKRRDEETTTTTISSSKTGGLKVISDDKASLLNLKTWKECFLTLRKRLSASAAINLMNLFSSSYSHNRLIKGFLLSKFQQIEIINVRCRIAIDAFRVGLAWLRRNYSITKDLNAFGNKQRLLICCQQKNFNGSLWLLLMHVGGRHSDISSANTLYQEFFFFFLFLARCAMA